VIEHCFTDEIRLLLKETIAETQQFLKKQIHLLDQVPAEDCQKVINSYRTATTTLQSLIRFTSFKFDESADEIDLNELLQELIQQQEFSDLEIEIKKLPTIHINRLRITELFHCLLANATKSKATRVKIACSKDNQFTFADNRPRMSKHDKKHLFHLLYSYKNQTRSNLHLFIANNIVDFYESKIIVVQSKLNETRFQFALPIEQN